RVSASSFSIDSTWNPSASSMRRQRMTRFGCTRLMCEYAWVPDSTNTTSYLPASSTGSNTSSTSLLPLTIITFWAAAEDDVAGLADAVVPEVAYVSIVVASPARSPDLQ